MHISILGSATYEVNIPKGQVEIVEELDAQLLPLFQHCERGSISTLEALMSAPIEITLPLTMHRLIPQVLHYFYWKQRSIPGGMAVLQRPYADEEELQNMELCDARCVEVFT